MSKEEFIQILNNEISSLPDHNDIISYYHELISDKIDAGYTEEEAVESLGNIDDIIKSIKENRNEEIGSDENIKEDNYSYTNDEEIKTQNNGPKELHGGKKFVYVLWCIATVIFCITAVWIMIISVAFMVAAVGVFAGSIYSFTKDVMLGLFILGLSFLIIAMAMVAIHYSKVLIKYIFGNRIKWNTSIRKALVGE